MFESKHFDELTQKLFRALPTSLQQVELDIQQKIKTVLQAAFINMDLITREEFDVQTKVLARTREKLELLQKQVDSLQATMECNKTN